MTTQTTPVAGNPASEQKQTLTTLSLRDAKNMMSILEDCFPLDLDAQSILARRLRETYPQFNWDKIQQMPMIIIVGEKNEA